MEDKEQCIQTEPKKTTTQPQQKPRGQQRMCRRKKFLKRILSWLLREREREKEATKEKTKGAIGNKYATKWKLNRNGKWIEKISRNLQ